MGEDRLCAVEVGRAVIGAGAAGLAATYRPAGAGIPCQIYGGGIDPLTRRCYHRCMETVTLKLDRRQVQKLRERSRATGRSQAAVVRELIDRHLGHTTPSLHEQAQDLCGSVAGAKNASTRDLTGYGRD